MEERNFTPRTEDDGSEAGISDNGSGIRDPSEIEDDGNALVLDPKNSDRQYWRDMRTRIEREIWRPGDGDGDRATDYYDKVKPPQNIGDRWKFYQLSLGPIKYEHNEPPKYVFLDDRAAYEIIRSNVPRTSLGKFWPHDFGMSGKIRDRRPHRGRGSVGDPDAVGNDQYDFSYVGAKNVRYYFTGEKDYTPVIYRSEELQAEIARKLEKKRKGWAVRYKGDPLKRSHNQFTPKQSMVKHGAPSASKPDEEKKKKKKKSKGEHKVPEWLLDKPKQPAQSRGLPYGGQGIVGGAEGHPTQATSQWNMQKDKATESPTKRRRTGSGGDALPEQAMLSSSPSQMFPFHRPAPEQHNNPLTSENPQGGILSSDFHTGRLPNAPAPHEDLNCPYVSSRLYASQLEKDLANARATMSRQSDKIEQLEREAGAYQAVIDGLRREVQDLRWMMAP